jgi:hypothetical protein
MHYRLKNGIRAYPSRLKKPFDKPVLSEVEGPVLSQVEGLRANGLLE